MRPTIQYEHTGILDIKAKTVLKKKLLQKLSHRCDMLHFNMSKSVLWNISPRLLSINNEILITHDQGMHLPLQLDSEQWQTG